MKTNIESEATVPILDLEIHDTDGVKIVSVMDLAVTILEDLSVDFNSSKESGCGFHNSSSKALKKF